MPMPGTIELFLLPGGRGSEWIATATWYKVPPNYDSLLAKLIVWAPTRKECIERSKRALNEFIVDGGSNNHTFSFKYWITQNLLLGTTTKFIDNYFLEPAHVKTGQ